MGILFIWETSFLHVCQEKKPVKMECKDHREKQRQTGIQLKVSSNPNVVFIIAFMMSKYDRFQLPWWLLHRNTIIKSW